MMVQNKIHKYKMLKNIILLLVISFLMFNDLTASTISTKIVVIVNANNELLDISAANLRRLWLGKTNEVDGVILSPMMSETQKKSKLIFYKAIHNKSENRLRKYYIREELKGKFNKPVSVKSLDILLEKILNDTTAISVMQESEIPDSLDIKILSVDGKHADNKNYFIK